MPVACLPSHWQLHFWLISEWLSASFTSSLSFSQNKDAGHENLNTTPSHLIPAQRPSLLKGTHYEDEFFSASQGQNGPIWTNICGFDAFHTANSDKYVYQMLEMLSGSTVCLHMWISRERWLKDLLSQNYAFLKTAFATLPTWEKMASKAQKVQSMINAIAFIIQIA